MARSTPSSPSRLPPLVALLALGACTQRVHLDEPVPVEDPRPAWKALLQEAVRPDGVDYAVIAGQRAVLERFLAWSGAHGPRSDAMKESAEDERIAFMVNAYNAAVILGVLERWPLESVRDVELGLLPVPNAGFFFAQRFYIDGEWVSLHNLEQQLIVNRYQEPLLHAVLNCASRSCPPLRFLDERGVQSQMQRAMRRFLASEHGLRPTADGGWEASALFDWYADDFVDWSDDDTVCGWMVDYTAGARRQWLEAHAADCPLRFQEYDWALNQASGEGADLPFELDEPPEEEHAPAEPARDEDEDEDDWSGQ